LKTKHALRGTVMKTGLVRDAHQTKRYVYSIQCDRGRCYIGETSRLLEVRIKKKLNSVACSPQANYTDQPSGRRLLAKLVPTFADRGYHVVSATDPRGR
jgi:hypothetical protein